MRTIHIEGTFTYDDDLMYNKDDEEEKLWFRKLLFCEGMPVFNDEIGDELGRLTITRAEK